MQEKYVTLKMIMNAPYSSIWDIHLMDQADNIEGQINAEKWYYDNCPWAKEISKGLGIKASVNYEHGWHVADLDGIKMTWFIKDEGLIDKLVERPSIWTLRKYLIDRHIEYHAIFEFNTIIDVHTGDGEYFQIWNMSDVLEKRKFDKYERNTLRRYFNGRLKVWQNEKNSWFFDPIEDDEDTRSDDFIRLTDQLAEYAFSCVSVRGAKAKTNHDILDGHRDSPEDLVDVREYVESWAAKGYEDWTGIIIPEAIGICIKSNGSVSINPSSYNPDLNKAMVSSFMGHSIHATIPIKRFLDLYKAWDEFDERYASRGANCSPGPQTL